MKPSDFVDYLVRPLLAHPDDLQVEQREAGVLVRANQEDIGKIIGKGGATINALRNLTQAYCVFHQIPFFNVVVEDQVPLAN